MESSNTFRIAVLSGGIGGWEVGITAKRMVRRVVCVVVRSCSDFGILI